MAPRKKKKRTGKKQQAFFKRLKGEGDAKNKKGKKKRHTKRKHTKLPVNEKQLAGIEPLAPLSLYKTQLQAYKDN